MKFWSYDGNSLEWHDTAEQARAAAVDALEAARDEAANDMWPSWTDEIAWGEVRERAVERIVAEHIDTCTEETRRAWEDGVETLDGVPVEECDCGVPDGADYTADYDLKPA